MRFSLTEHAVMRFKQRFKENLKKDNFDLYLTLQKESKECFLDYISEDGQTYYCELPHFKNLYFVINKSSMVCATIKPLSYKEKSKLNYPTSHERF